MRRTRTVLFVVAVLSVALAAVPASADSATIQLKPKVGPPTAKVTVTGSGFGATETVIVNFDTTQVATATTDSAGSFSTTFKVPKSALPGSHTVTATGQTSGLSASATFLVRTDWAQFHFDAANTGNNPDENVIGRRNVAALTQAWTAATTNAFSLIGSPTVAGGIAYVGGWDNKLYAFDAAGTTNCSDTPKTCLPLWTAQAGSTTPAVAKGVVYVATGTTLFAFDASGTTNCSGAPKVCQPLWTGAITGGSGFTLPGSPTVANGVVYVGGSLCCPSALNAFDAAGITNCSGTPKTCQPLWTGPTIHSITSTPAVANGVVYIGESAFSPGALYAFDAAGTTNCSGTPKVCQPLWTGSTGHAISSSPAVANGVAYVGDTNGALYAFDASGTTNCSGTPKVCQPLWSATTGGGSSSTPAVAGGVVYFATNGKLYAFDAAGTTNCSGTLTTCLPLWTSVPDGYAIQGQSPAVANGLVYVADNGHLYAFSAAGTTNCSGTPKMCLPLWNVAQGFFSPAVANGVVYAMSGGTLYAFHG